MKVAINKCFGGFSASDALFGALIAKGWEVTKYDENWEYENPNARIVDTGESDYGFSRYSFVGDRSCIKLRTDLDLIDAIEKLGEAASGLCGDIRVVEVRMVSILLSKITTASNT